MRKKVIAVLTLAALSSLALAKGPKHDFGQYRDEQLSKHSEQLFGFEKPLDEASTASIDAATAEKHPTKLVTLAKGLKAKVVSADSTLGANIDMMALWPDDKNPTHLIACNEQGTSEPGVQRIRLSDGLVETILTGTSSCDPAHRTAWGTIVVGEEAGDSGSLLEIIDPLNTTGVTYNRVAHTFSGGVGTNNIAYRPAVGHLSFEGIALYPNGVMYYGDENRPSQGKAGGAYFKFIPTSPFPGGAPITDLTQSPLAGGQVYGLRLGKRSGNTDYGQGSNTGKGVWIMIPGADANLRAAAETYKLTGYYRPEDLAIDLAALKDGNVRFCGNNTGNEENDRNWGEAICITDGTLAEAEANTATPEVQLFVPGSFKQGMMDNIAYQPGRGNWVIHEDRDAVGMSGGAYPFNNSIHVCLDDGADPDTLSDGCVRFATVNDLNAETTGGLFDASGKKFYFSVQHNVTGHGVILEVTGWK